MTASLERNQKCSLFVMIWAGLLLALIGVDVLGPDVCRASSIDVQLNGHGVKIVARQAPLIDVLKALADKAECELLTGDDLAEIVNLDFKLDSVESCVRRLLTQRDFALFYRRGQDRKEVLFQIRVLGKERVTAYGGRQEDEVEVDNHMKDVEKSWFTISFADKELLSKQITVKNSSQPSDIHEPYPQGIQITKLSEKSAFSRIGIMAGDIIHDVNGTPVHNREELIQALQMAPGLCDPPIIRLERMDQHGVMNPIYIKLN